MKRTRIFLLILSLLLAACSNGTPQVEPGATVATVTLPASPLPPTDTPRPTATDTPTPQPALALLLAPPGSDALLASELESALRAPLEQAGLRFERGEALGELSPELRLVVALPPDPGLAALAASAAQVQFVGVGIAGLEPASNLSVIGPQGLRLDQQGFIAGVTAATITPDWRVGVLSVADTPEGAAARQGFLNGVIYVCGLCLPYHGPSVDYPVYAETPVGASPAEWQAAVQSLADQAVQTVYVTPAVTDAAAWEALRQAKMALIGGTPPPDDLMSRWVVTLRPDPALPLLKILPQLLSGQGGASLELPVRLYQVNAERLSPGRQTRVEEILLDMLAGYIDTGINP